jgi:hypothetical protein
VTLRGVKTTLLTLINDSSQFVIFGSLRSEECDSADARARLVAFPTRLFRRMQEQERLASQVLDRHAHYVARSHESRLGMPDSSFSLQAMCAKPVVREGKPGAAVIVLPVSTRRTRPPSTTVQYFSTR